MARSLRLRWRVRVALPVIGAAVALVAGTSPAWAVGGSGSYSGATNQTSTKQSPSCFETVGSFSNNVTGGTGTGSLGAYSGPITVTFSYDFFQNSTGSTTYGDTTCSAAGSGYVTKASISGTSGSSTVSCSWGSSANSFTRSGTSLTVVFPSSAGGCSVNGGANSATTVTSSGTFSNCVFGNGTNQPPTSCDESYTYSATS